VCGSTPFRREECVKGGYPNSKEPYQSQTLGDKVWNGKYKVDRTTKKVPRIL